ncbi:MAG TPA: DNA damage-inducible protein D [Rhabdochlamydiaceae bacterium]|nr:DNA damage-inducible protein D [Rhabdochlamydiaceae bacterium]
MVSSEYPLPTSSNPSFESLKKHNQYGVEYWSARDLQPHLGYSQWRRFDNAIKKAIESCRQSGNNPQNHFASAGKMVGIGSQTDREVEDYHLSRFACYLIAQNGDPRKLEIAHAQKYFAIQTRRQEISDQMAADLERIETREQAKMEFKALSGAARDAGVQNKMFGIFHDAGYKGLYGGLGVEAIKSRKGIAPKEQLLDRMNTTELAANLFRMTQTKEKLKKEKIRDQKAAIETHEAVGTKVRLTIQEIGGTLPENIPPAEPIKSVEKRLKTAHPRLTLDPQDAIGIANHIDSSE